MSSVHVKLLVFLQVAGAALFVLCSEITKEKEVKLILALVERCNNESNIR